jgi:hypothetical protein
MAGDSQDKAILALNIAVYGVGTSQANAYVHDPNSTNGNGVWQEAGWTKWIADGKDNYIGSTKPGAPVMSGFGIGVSTGQICQNIRFSGAEWGTAPVCQDSKKTWNFGGTVDNNRALEAVQFTVPASVQ